MKIRHVVFFVALIMLNLIVTRIVQATEWDVTFKVPLTLTGFDSAVVKLDVTCIILDQNGVLIGSGITKVPMTNGAYSGPLVNVSVKAFGPTYPTTWRCSASQLYDVHNISCAPAFTPKYPFCKLKYGNPNDNTFDVDGKF